MSYEKGCGLYYGAPMNALVKFYRLPAEEGAERCPECHGELDVTTFANGVVECDS